MEVIWKELKNVGVIDFPYEVSNWGEVRSLNYNRTGKAQIIKIRPSISGNRCVQLAGGKSYSIAQLVLTAFGKPKPSDKHGVRHVDGNHQNDCLGNLEWQPLSIQNKLNGKNGAKFQKGHVYHAPKSELTDKRFKKGHTIGIEYRFKKQPKVAEVHYTDVSS